MLTDNAKKSLDDSKDQLNAEFKNNIFNNITTRQGTIAKKITPIELEAAAREEEEILLRNKKSSLKEGIDNFNFKPDTKVLVFAREVSGRGVPLGTEVTFFTSTEKDPLRTSFYVPNERGILVLDLVSTINYTINTGYSDEPHSNEYSTVIVKEQSINLRKLLNKVPLTALNTDTLNVIDKNPKLARFIEDHCTSEYNLQELTVSDEIKSILGSEEGLVISETTPTNLVHTVYTELGNW